MEYSHIVGIVVYVQPHAVPAVACDVIHEAVVRVQTQHPDALAFPPISLALYSMSTAPLGKLRLWTCCMQMPRRNSLLQALATAGDLDRANVFNLFYNRFDSASTGVCPAPPATVSPIPSPSPAAAFPPRLQAQHDHDPLHSGTRSVLEWTNASHWHKVKSVRV